VLAEPCRVIVLDNLITAGEEGASMAVANKAGQACRDKDIARSRNV